MKIILITGMSGTGKSSVIEDLLAKGYKAVDLDSESFSYWADAAIDTAIPDNEVKPGKDWLWDEHAVTKLLSAKDRDILFVSGCASNMGNFYSYFDSIILLTATNDVIKERLSHRQEGSYGWLKEEVDRALRLKTTIEPLLRKVADLEIDTGSVNQSTSTLILNYLDKMA